MDVKQRNDELNALRQQVEALTASRERLRDHIAALEEAHSLKHNAPKEMKVAADNAVVRTRWMLRDEDLDDAPPLPAVNQTVDEIYEENFRIQRIMDSSYPQDYDPAPSLPVLDPRACAERDTTPLEWDGESK